MVHECNINSRTMDIETAEALGIEDPGAWIPFIIDMDEIYAAKEMTHDTANSCTGILCYDNEVYLIDTPFTNFKKAFAKHKNQKNEATRTN